MDPLLLEGYDNGHAFLGKRKRKSPVFQLHPGPIDRGTLPLGGALQGEVHFVAMDAKLCMGSIE